MIFLLMGSIAHESKFLIFLMFFCRLGGNPVCQNQSFPLADICQYSGATLKAETWQQQTSCASICNQNSVAHPVTCKCSYPYICNMFFGWSSTYGLEGARIGHLRRELASELSVSAEDLWIDQAVYEDSRELKVFAKVLFYPAASIQQWDASQFTYIESQIVNKTIRLAGYDPYGIVSSNLLSTPLNSGKGNLSDFTSCYLVVNLETTSSMVYYNANNFYIGDSFRKFCCNKKNEPSQRSNYCRGRCWICCDGDIIKPFGVLRQA